jgi:Xaa-Pro aminopeptidase
VTAEQHGVVTAARRGEVEEKLRILRRWLERESLAGVVLGGVDAVAWLSAGLTTPVERGVAVGPLRLVVTQERVAALTTNVEWPRLSVEAGLDELGIPLAEAPWFEPGALEHAAAELAGVPPAALASDLPSGYGRVCADELVALRLALGPPERERLGVLASEMTAALEGALAAWQPGELDLELRARIDEALERRGAFAACLIVGGDERVGRYRHPLACGAELRRLVMAVAVAERGGLHAAVTRFACAGGLPETVRSAARGAREVEQAMLSASRPGVSYGEVMEVCARAYADVGQPGAWREHYQGGPVGYRQREFEPVPGQRESRWFDTRIELGHALAWNPSLAGGGKVEDTYLVEPGGLRRLTDSGSWPLDGDGLPAILDLDGGGAA